MNKQIRCYTSIKRIVMISVIAAIVVAAAVAVFAWLISIEAPFFDEKAVAGSPVELLNGNETYRIYSAQGICDAAVCEIPEVTEGKNVHVFLTNMETNSVYIRAEIYTVAFVRNENGQVTDYYHDKLLGKTGFIRPGEYVETLVLDDALDADETYAMIKIATCNIDDGTSNGSFFVNTILYRDN